MPCHNLSVNRCERMTFYGMIRYNPIFGQVPESEIGARVREGHGPLHTVGLRATYTILIHSNNYLFPSFSDDYAVISQFFYFLATSVPC